jgi:hypothetical protein
VLVNHIACYSWNWIIPVYLKVSKLYLLGGGYIPSTGSPVSGLSDKSIKWTWNVTSVCPQTNAVYVCSSEHRTDHAPACQSIRLNHLAVKEGRMTFLLYHVCNLITHTWCCHCNCLFIPTWFVITQCEDSIIWGQTEGIQYTHNSKHSVTTKTLLFVMLTIWSFYHTVLTLLDVLYFYNNVSHGRVYCEV